MLVEHADDKSMRLALLEDLQRCSLLDKRQCDWLSDEHYRIKPGIQRERDAGFYLNN
ncbi:MAG: hypothetical protein IV092_26905 [Burkholderiaceae bacterium]|nr:hypothetical protein [Burkholderiaceae bacterium]